MPIRTYDPDASPPRYATTTYVRTATEGARVATELAARYEAEHPITESPATPQKEEGESK